MASNSNENKFPYIGQDINIINVLYLNKNNIHLENNLPSIESSYESFS